MARKQLGPQPRSGLGPVIVLSVAIVCLCVAGLIGWRWYLAERRFELTHKAVERDTLLAEMLPRLKALESKINDVEWAKAGRR